MQHTFGGEPHKTATQQIMICFLFAKKKEEDEEMNAKEFFERYNGQAIDDDNAYGVQCVDAFRVFCREIGIDPYPTGTGWADGYWLGRADHADVFDFVEGSQNFRNGDWVVFPRGCVAAPDSHICMYYNGKAFGQRQQGNGDRSFCLIDIDFSQAYGALRAKALEPDPEEPAESIDDIAKEVIAGTWGNGTDRTNALTNAGYDSNAVQARVNELMAQSQPAADIDDLARRTIAGEFGNGDDRRNALGDNYDAVQARVNELMAQSQPAADIDDLARRTIAGEFGDGDARRAALGDLYDQVQARVNEMM
ncbi:MAG: hypothetical protein LKF53_02245 [Solobacterium sp.]|jgi:hypothetical protein|nr:hypothetical protein [Solobacterium sp.]MCH4226792.1 hypothetical protein [Solobacterium sp.]MCH4281879.1 hypothetical protein [Solobacterium sp.]